MKYVILVTKASGWLCPIVFDETVPHRDAVLGTAKAMGPFKLVSAGFVHRRRGEWVCGGDSESLGGIKSREEDAVILNLFLKYGLTGLDLQNMISLSVMNPELFKQALEKL